MAGNANFAVFSVVTRPESGYSNSDQITGGGLSIKGPSSGSFEPVIASISPNSGKWYWEYRAGQGGGSSYGRPAIGTSNQTVVKNEDYMGGASGQVGVLFTVNDGGKRISGSDSSYGNAVSQNDIVQIALDCDNGAVYLGINNTWQNSGDPTSGSSKTGAALTANIQNVDIDIIHTRYNGGGIDRYNFGQDDTFGGAISAAGNADGNGFGVFKYAPPTGFLALCTANLSVSSDIDPAGDDGADDNPTKHFNAVLYSGTGSAQSIDAGLGQPDLVWIKRRNSDGDHRLVDSTRGVGVALRSNVTGADVSEANGVTAFGTDGFTLGSEGGYNASSDTFVGWCWKANGGTTASNSEGSITTTVQANTKAGFSIITYTGNGSNATIGHGLTKAPEFVIFKRRSGSAQNWRVYHAGIGATKRLTLNDTRAAETVSTFQDTTPTSTVIYIGSDSNVNTSSGDQLAYAWHSVEGSSKFGRYEGNGNNDGAFIYTGFRPRLVFIKNADAAQHWVTHDSARETFNPMDTPIDWDESYAEYTSSARAIDFLSNGFKCRTSDGEINSSQTFVYGAWGDVPFKYNNTF